MPGKPNYYWDSCTFIKWLTGKATSAELDGLAEIVRAVENGEANLFTSALTKTEVLKGKMTSEQRQAWEKLFQRKNVVSVDIGDRILALSERIREWNPKISVPDAIHLATAIIYKADEFHTSDGGGKRKRKGDLLPLSGDVAGHNLKITTPHARQATLFSGVAQANEEEKSRSQTKPESPQVSGSGDRPTEGQAGTEGKK
jgi:predicted nucleic acid-binding protein